ncbi:MAG TPA: hypothetical protein VJ890_15910, partial [Vineibacter sp.]|nr:hypothetical protein [Vineibacter sp.]
EFFRDVEDWEFRVYYIRPASAQDVVEAMPRTAIEDSLRTIEGLLSREQLQPAVLISWATFEALGRALLPQKLTRPQAPRQLVETLASDGFVTPSEADVARRIADERNRIAHGDLQLGVERAEICQFIAILNTLLGLVPASR